jgi:hypothetical protein
MLSSVVLLVVAASLAVTSVSARPATCFVHPTDALADFHSLQEAIYKCGSGNHEIQLIVSGGTLKEGTILVSPHLKSLAIVSSERNLDLSDAPAVIVGAFNVEHSTDLWIELSHVILDGGDYLPSIFASGNSNHSALSSLHVLGCIVRRYTGAIFDGVDYLKQGDNDFYVANTAIVGKPDVDPQIEKAMPFPWTLNRAAAYAKEAVEEKN